VRSHHQAPDHQQNGALKMAKKIIAESVAKQLEFVLSGIAENADALERLLIECVMSDENDAIAQLLTASKTLAQQIGWAADLGVQKLGGVLIMKGSAEAWMMPPAYHSAIKDMEVSHI
jgi:hypothetical protein